jgi:hypothetical protein
MIARTAVAIAVAAFAVPALAQSNDGYDPGRTCRAYVMQKMPVPVRCMAELVGNWSAHPYIDGEFMFRNRQDYLLWRDREDYHHWKAHDYAWHAGMAPTPVNPPVSQPIPPPAPPPPAPPPPAVQAGAALLCPAEISVRLVPGAVNGWNASDGTGTLRREGPPHTDGSTLYCSYGPGHVTLARPAWGHCTVRSDGAGFDCTP